MKDPSEHLCRDPSICLHLWIFHAPDPQKPKVFEKFYFGLCAGVAQQWPGCLIT